jgi:peptidoglycan/xylan/chitin deacetylase (PgdA/CDA1 family)
MDKGIFNPAESDIYQKESDDKYTGNMNTENPGIEGGHELTGSSEELDHGYLKADDSKRGILSIDAEKAYVYDGIKYAFLTFDDGPSKNITPQVLDILKKYDIKATFFVLGSLSARNGELLKDIADSGHAIGIHTYSHNYKAVYESTGSFINEIKMTDTVLKQTLGSEFHTRLFRFPGGSFESYKSQYKDILNANGYVSIDWNVVNGDGEYSDLDPQNLLDRLKATSKGKRNLVVLMHDSSGKQTTVDVLPGAIEYLKSQGYEFAVLK